MAVTATAVAMISRLYSKPPAELKKPFFQWTVPIAFSITTVSASAANGVRRPSANSKPPPSSLRPAMKAIASGVRKPSPAKKRRVPAGPLPPKEPNSFCEPCAASARPATTRKRIIPYSI
jgi:hypothetical protein